MKSAVRFFLRQCFPLNTFSFGSPKISMKKARKIPDNKPIIVARETINLRLVLKGNLKNSSCKFYYSAMTENSS